MKMLQDHDGKTSVGRVTSVGCLIVACIFSFMLIGRDGDISYNELWLVCIWVLAGVSQKSIGKFIEKMEPPKQ